MTRLQANNRLVKLKTSAHHEKAALLHSSQGQWADAKPDNPYGGGGGNIWSDGLWSDDEPTTDGEDTNWAGYKKDMSLW